MRYPKYFVTVIAVLLLALGLWSMGSQQAMAQGGIIGKMKEVLKKTEGSAEKGKEGVQGEERKKAEDPNLPDELKWRPDFLDAGDEKDREKFASGTDEEGNTITSYKTKGGVFVTETRDKDGNLIRVKKEKELPNGGKKVEKIDYKTGKRTQEVYDRNGKLVSSLTIDEKKETRVRAVYIGGIISGSKSIDGQGNITRSTYKDGKVEYSDTKDKDGNVKRTVERETKDGIETVKVVDNEKGITTVTATAPDGSKMFETRDNETGETLNSAGLDADGNPTFYQTGKYANEAFQQGGVVATSKITSSQDWKQDTEEYQIQFHHQQQKELDERLVNQMKGGEAVGGSDLVVSGRYSSLSESFEREGSGRDSDWGEITQTKSDYEIRGVDPNGDYEVKPLGNPVAAEGLGDTPSQALANALDEASMSVSVHIQSELVDHWQHTQEMQGGQTTNWSFDKSIRDESQHDSFVVFKDYVVESVSRDADTGGYAVKINARPGVTTKR